MENLFNLLNKDFRFQDALNACMNCGICTAICPAAEFYDYDPRRICDIVQRKNESEIENLLRSEMIWSCGQCLSCKTRCPRNNVPAEIITVLRKISIEYGFSNATAHEQQKRIMDKVGNAILDIGYCVHPDIVIPEEHPEQGPIWEWYYKNIEKIAPKIGANYNGEGPGALRKIHQKNLDEIKKIFEVTGGMKFKKKLLDEE